MRSEEEIRKKIMEVSKLMKHYEKIGVYFLADKYTGYLEGLKWVLGEDDGDR